MRGSYPVAGTPAGTEAGEWSLIGCTDAEQSSPLHLSSSDWSGTDSYAKSSLRKVSQTYSICSGLLRQVCSVQAQVCWDWSALCMHPACAQQHDILCLASSLCPAAKAGEQPSYPAPHSCCLDDVI